MTNEEMALSIQAGDTSLLLPLFKQNMGFIYQQAKKWEEAFQTHPEYDIEDLQQNAYFAVLEAAQRFDPNKGLYITMLAYTLKTAFAELCGVRTEAQRKDPVKSPLRLEEPIFDDGGYATLSDTIADPRDDMEAVEDAMYAVYVSDTVRKAVDSLGEQQRLCISLRYLQGKTKKRLVSNSIFPVSVFTKWSGTACAASANANTRRSFQRYITARVTTTREQGAPPICAPAPVRRSVSYCARKSLSAGIKARPKN